MIARHIRVIGRVQGVFFRASAKAKADELNIKGSVRNEPGGTVYIEAEGESANMEQFVDWCRQGPPRSRVDNLDVRDAKVTGYLDFSVLR
jgi:acylphosphatase